MNYGWSAEYVLYIVALMNAAVEMVIEKSGICVW